MLNLIELNRIFEIPEGDSEVFVCCYIGIQGYEGIWTAHCCVGALGSNTRKRALEHRSHPEVFFFSPSLLHFYLRICQTRRSLPPLDISNKIAKLPTGLFTQTPGRQGGSMTDRVRSTSSKFVAL